VPDQDDLFRGPAGERRRYLDRLVLAVHPEHGGAVSRFERLMRERNRLLEDRQPDPIWLSAIEKEAAEAAIAIAAARAETTARLQSIMERLQDEQRGSPFPAAGLSLEGVLEARVPHEPASDIEGWYRETLQAQRPLDRGAGRALIGPQASDLLVTHRGKAMPAERCSTGEQKALLIGLIMAQGALVTDMTGMRPILLLDEIAAHLDRKRRAALHDRLLALGCQVFMTGTDQSLFADAPAGTLSIHIADGHAQRE
jgi:DNA replication and repair protein RecF